MGVGPNVRVGSGVRVIVGEWKGVIVGKGVSVYVAVGVALGGGVVAGVAWRDLNQSAPKPRQ